MSNIMAINQLIKNAARAYLPGGDWRLLKAQLMQESQLNPKAVSPVGAQGIAQFMPATWSEMKKTLARDLGIIDADPFNVEHAIPACAIYMRQRYETWTAPRPELDRYCLALASYNAGTGNILKAQKLAGGANDYVSIIAKLHLVTGIDNSNETKNYVVRIFNYWGQYALQGVV
ncbi:MAG: transglycosylase SLT domain-containing protein [Porticoccaceae bacterium]|nr:transglycosylase SLT domain-containing protein [Porticoccaceae bacterium]